MHVGFLCYLCYYDCYFNLMFYISIINFIMLSTLYQEMGFINKVDF